MEQQTSLFTNAVTHCKLEVDISVSEFKILDLNAVKSHDEVCGLHKQL